MTSQFSSVSNQAQFAHIRFMQGSQQLALIEAKKHFQHGDIVGFESFNYKGMVVGFAEENDGTATLNKLPVLVVLDPEFTKSSNPMVVDYHSDQLILIERPALGLALV